VYHRAQATSSRQGHGLMSSRRWCSATTTLTGIFPPTKSISPTKDRSGVISKYSRPLTWFACIRIGKAATSVEGASADTDSATLSRYVSSAFFMETWLTEQKILRDTNAETVRDSSFDASIGTNFSWKEFVAQEELIRYDSSVTHRIRSLPNRTFLWIFLLDTCFVIFNNLPPRMVIRELQLRMAYPEACFQADTAEECARAMRDWRDHLPTMADISLREAIQVFCSDNLVPSVRCELANLGPLNLFVIISGK
jgi:hypothetical protein